MLVHRVGHDILFHILTLMSTSDPTTLACAVTSITPSSIQAKVEMDADREISTHSAWDEILAAIGNKSPFTRGYLCMGKLVSIEPNCITIGFQEGEGDCIELVNNHKTNHAILAAAFPNPSKDHKVKYVVIPSNE